MLLFLNFRFLRQKVKCVVAGHLKLGNSHFNRRRLFQTRELLFKTKERSFETKEHLFETHER